MTDYSDAEEKFWQKQPSAAPRAIARGLACRVSRIKTETPGYDMVDAC